MAKTNKMTFRFDQNGSQIDGKKTTEVTMNSEKLENMIEEQQDMHLYEVVESNDTYEAAQKHAAIHYEVDKLEKLIRQDLASYTDKFEKADIDTSTETDPLSWPLSNEENNYFTERKKYEQDIETEQEESVYSGNFNRLSGDFSHLSEEVKLQQQATSLSSAHNKKHVEFTWLQGAISVCSAVLSGVIIGYLMLTLVFGISIWPFSTMANAKNIGNAQENSGHMLAPDQNQAGSDNITTLPNENHVAEPTITNLNQLSFEYYVLQVGVFSQQKSLEQLLSTLESAGYKGHVWKGTEDKQFVYAGVATSSSSAEPVKAAIRGTETYKKSITITVPSSLNFSGDADVFDQWVVQSNSLIQMYADLVSIQFEQTSFSPIGDAVMTLADEQYHIWLTLTESIISDLIEDKDVAYATRIQDQLTKVHEEMKNYQQKTTSSQLWKVQDLLTEAVLLQKEWFEKVN